MKSLLFLLFGGLLFGVFWVGCIDDTDVNLDHVVQLRNNAEQTQFTLQVLHDVEVEGGHEALCMADRGVLNLPSRLLDISIVHEDEEACVFIDAYNEVDDDRNATRSERGVPYAHTQEVILCNAAMHVVSADTAYVDKFELSESILSMLVETDAASLADRKRSFDSLAMSVVLQDGYVLDQGDHVSLVQFLSNGLLVKQTYSLETYFLVAVHLAWPDGIHQEQFYSYACDAYGKLYLAQIVLTDSGLSPICRKAMTTTTYYLFSEPQTRAL